MRRQHIPILLGLVLFVSGGLTACYPGGPTTADDRDLVVTVKQWFEIGLIATEKNNWHFGVAPGKPW